MSDYDVLMSLANEHEGRARGRHDMAAACLSEGRG